MPELDDAGIITRVLGGDNNAFEQLIERHKVRVFAVVSRHVPIGDVAEVAQGVFIRAWRGLRNFRGESPFSHWLSKLAVRECYDFWRERARRREFVGGNLSAENVARLAALLNAGAREISNSLESRREAREIVTWALGKLSAADRIVITLLYAEECSIDEAAELLGWSATNVKVRAFRARRLLRKIILENLQEEDRRDAKK